MILNFSPPFNVGDVIMTNETGIEYVVHDFYEVKPKGGVFNSLDLVKGKKFFKVANIVITPTEYQGSFDPAHFDTTEAILTSVQL